MHMSFSDLVSHSQGFPTIAWPRGYSIASLDSGVNALLHSAHQLVATRESHFLNKIVAVVSSHQEDWLLAMALTCFGARVHFLCPARPVWNQEVHPLFFRTLREKLELDHPHLDLKFVRNANAETFDRNDRFRIEQRVPLGDKDPLKGLCEFIFVADFLNVGENFDLDDMLELITDVRTLSQTGTCIEVFGECSSAKDVEILDGLVQSSGHLGLGMEFAAKADQTPGDFRISFLSLSEPIFEYPRAEQDHSVLLAHCEARLKFASQFVRGARMLEAGCGTGIGARMFRAEGAAHVTGLDYSDKALQVAERITRDNAIVFRQWNLNQTPLPLPSDAFDLVVCLEVLEHIENHERLFDEFYRVLKPGGRLVISIPNKRYEDEWVAFNHYRNIYHVRVPGREDFEKLLGRFEQVKFARQIDFVGSVVVEEGKAVSNPAPVNGDFAFQPGKIDFETAEVILAYGSKAGAAGDRHDPVIKPHLRVFDNFLATQLDWRRSVTSLRNCYVDEQYQRWSDKNRAEVVIDNLVQQNRVVTESSASFFDENLIHGWIATQTEAFAGTPIEPGPWMDRLGQLARQNRKLGSEPMTLSGEWEIVIQADAGIVFRRIVPRFGEKPPNAASVVFPKEESRSSLRVIWQWRRRGVSEVWFLEDKGWKRVDMVVLLARRLYKTLTRSTLFGLSARLGLHSPESFSRVMTATQKVFRRPGIAEVLFPFGSADVDALWQSFIHASNSRPVERVDDQRPVKITQYTGALYAGGAERQLCNLALGLKSRGVDVNVLTTDDLANDRGHYRHLLREPGIEVRRASVRSLTSSALRTLSWHLLRMAPKEIAEPAIALAAELSANRPDVLHCWLDQPNVIGALAGLVADVPAIVLSTRNSNPTNFPRINYSYLQKWYVTLAKSNRVHFIANSHSGAASYAEWLGLPVERFHVIFNGVCWDHFPQASADARRRARAEFGFGAADRVVCGAFRLAAEKQPTLFLEVVRRVRERVPNLRVLLAGAGDLEGDVRDFIQKNDMSGYVQLLGRRNDVGTILLASDASLLTSTLEGCPNIALESQHLGVPIVATAGGGTTDAVVHGKTGFLAGVQDSDALTDHLSRLLLDDGLRAVLSAAATDFIQERFGLNTMVENTYQLCQDALDPSRRAVAPPRAQKRDWAA